MSRTLLSPGIYKYILFIALLASFAATATEVKWTASTEHAADPAATAPRSQRYWDEHGIKRPDYAKTDAEISAERGERPRNTVATFSLIGILAGLACGWYWKRNLTESSGARLGSSSRSGSSKLFFFDDSNCEDDDEDAVRKARLAHFQQGKQD